MAIKTFKQIIENKGYRINPQDRKVFEDSDIQSFFGVSENDLIEFVLYDANDNQLIQNKFGLARYIPLTSENISDYFLLPEGTVFQKYKFPSEYFIDAKRLIKEAGYDSGIFKTQITLINKRLGSNKENDKVWIQEISPSRTEIRVLPLKKGLETYSELAQQYNAFVNDLDFKDDTLRNAFEFIEQINTSNISNYLKSKYSESWVQKLVQEYNLKNIDIFCTQIYNKFLEGIIYDFTNRVSDINDLNYGKPKIIDKSITLSKEQVVKRCEIILVNVLNKFMLMPNINYGSKTNQKIESINEAEKIIKTKTSDLVIERKIIEPEVSIRIKPPVETPDKIIKPILKDILEKDILITNDDIIPIDDVGIKPKETPPIEVIFNPGKKFIRDGGIVIDRPNRFMNDEMQNTFERIQREIIE